MSIETTYERGDKFIRVLTLVDLLGNTHQGKTTKEIADELGIDQRSAQRYLKQVGEAGLDIVRDDQNRYRVGPGSLLPTMQFTKPEGVAVLTALRLLQQMRSSRDPALVGAVGRLAEVMQIETVTSYLGQMLEAAEALPEGNEHSQVENVLTQCFVNRIPCEIEYEDFAGKVSKRVIRTYFLEPRADTRTIYAYALDDAAKAMRWFRLDRIRAAREVRIAGTYTVPEDFDISAVTRSSWGIWQVGDGPLDDVVLRFSPAAAPRARESAWHPSTVLTELADGTVEMRVSVASELEMRPWVLGWGAQVEVLGPPSLRDHVARTMRDGVQMYDTHLSPG